MEERVNLHQRQRRRSAVGFPCYTSLGHSTPGRQQLQVHPNLTDTKRREKVPLRIRERDG
jgi:hypothetical protein